ncbi:MAG: outer membrane protein transport protein [Polyangiaceae bacterium]|nr:outer membrane protein transport protein [Polyangiaceae bacterium]
MAGAPSHPSRVSKKRALSAIAAAAIATLPAGAARASGIDGPAVGSGRSGPAVADPAAVYWNPAMLGWVQRTELQMGAALVVGRASYQRDRLGTYQTPDTLQFKTPLDPANVDPTKTGPAEEVTATPVAAAGDIFLAYPVLKDRLTLGAGFYVPYALAGNFPDDGPQAWQIRQAFIIASHLTVSAAARVTDELSVGAGVSYVFGFAELSKLQDFASLEDFQRAFSNDPINQENDFGPDAPSEVRELDVLSRPISLKSATSHGASFNLGLGYRPREDLSFGLSYQHGSKMHYTGNVAIDMSDDFFTQDLASQGLKYKPLVKGEGVLSFSLPRRITAGASFQASDKLRVDGFVSYILYSDIEEFVVETTSPDLAQPRLGIGETVKVSLPRRWNDTVWIEGRAHYRLNDWLLLSGALGYQSPASPDSTADLASLDGHRLLGGLGGEIKVSDGFTLSGDLRLQGILPRTVTESEHDLGNGTYNLFIATAGGHLKILL